MEILWDIDALERDPATAELIRSGRTMGCFYIESPSMRSLFHRMRCEGYEDVIAASSIIRPGVAESGMMKAYIERRRDPRKVEYLHPALADLLAETYGVMVYQEDVIRVVHALGGLSLGEADILRRAMSGKAGAQEAMESLTERFFAGCRERGVPEQVIRELWRQIETFARFSFCKGHSAAFAVLSYQVAYLKAHYPAEFMAAVLGNGGGFYGAAAYIQECRRMGLRVLGPDINESRVDYTGQTEATGQKKGAALGWVRIGFGAIKNFPLDLAHRIIAVRNERPFDSFADFLHRVRPGREAAEKLVRVGAFDRFAIAREQLLIDLDVYFRAQTDGTSDQLVMGLDDGRRGPTHGKKSGARGGKMEAGGERREVGCEMAETAMRTARRSSHTAVRSDLVRRVADEIELLGYGVSAHPLELLPDGVWRGTVAARDLRRHVGRRVTMVGWPIASKLVRTHQTREFMKFLSLEDLTGTFEVTLFPRAYRRFAPLTLGPGPFRIRGKVEDDLGALGIVADRVEIIDTMQEVFRGRD